MLGEKEAGFFFGVFFPSVLPPFKTAKKRCDWGELCVVVCSGWEKAPPRARTAGNGQLTCCFWPGVITISNALEFPLEPLLQLGISDFFLMILGVI